MHLKLITPVGNFRFNVRGEEISSFTEPFILVEGIETRESILCLYDQNAEHLVNAFHYDEQGRITGINPDKVRDAIQDFLLNDSAWYYENPKQPEEDLPDTNPASAYVVREVAEPVAIETDEIGSAIPSFVPTPDQQALIRKVIGMADLQMRLEPNADESWTQKVQRILLSQGKYGTDDEAAGLALANSELSNLYKQAEEAGIPRTVVETAVACKRASFTPHLA